MARQPTTTGIDHLVDDPAWQTRLAGKHIGVLTNDACRLADGRPTAVALHNLLALDCVLTAEHGAATTITAGAPVGHGVHAATGLPVWSLYGTPRHRAIAHARTLDAVIIDLRDLGVRCYTYATTAADLIAGLCGTATEVIVCDRPNPLGVGQIGPRPQPALRSFLAYFDVPFVHGQTLGGLLHDFHARLGPDKPPLTVVATDPPDNHPPRWVPPSPALDHPDTVPLYPGLVLFEGTNVNEGRGTRLPFRSVSAPWLGPADADALAAAATCWPATGITARPWRTRPGAGPTAGRLCHGLALRVTDPGRANGFDFAIRLLCRLARHPRFRWTTAPVSPRALPWHPPAPSSRRARPVIDTLFGSTGLRHAIANGKTATAIIRDQRTAPLAPCPGP